MNERDSEGVSVHAEHVLTLKTADFESTNGREAYLPQYWAYNETEPEEPMLKWIWGKYSVSITYGLFVSNINNTNLKFCA